MGKISNYAQDTTVNLADKLIGSDQGGTTANFTLTSISNLFKESNAAGVGGQFTWKFDSGAGSNLTAGEMDIASTGGSLNFSALTTLIFSEFTNENPSTNLENAISLLASRSILIVDVLNHNNYGVFSTGTLSAYAGTTTLHSIPLTHTISNGALVDGKVYAVTINYPDGDTTYSISCVDGANSDEEKIRLTNSASVTDDVVLEAGTGLTIARSSDKITFTNTQDITNANLLTRLAALESASGVGDENITIGTDSGDTIIITGNLQVSGTTTTVNSTTVNLNDHNIVLDSGNSTSAVVDGAGITLEGGSGDDVTWQWLTSGTKMELKVGSSYGTAKFGTVDAATLQVGGSAISLDNLSDVKIAHNSVFLGNIPASLDGAGGGDSVIIGHNAGEALTSGDSNVLIGKGAGELVTAQSHNIFIGTEAGKANTLGSNVGIGSGVLEASTSASDNVAVGHAAGNNLETGDNNIYIGRDTRAGAVDAANEVVVGNQATGKGSNTVVLGNASTTVWLPYDDNGVDLGSAALSFKDGYFDGSLLCTQNFRRTVTTASESSGTHTCTLVDNDNFNIAVTNAATTIALTVATENIGQSGMITITNPASVGSLSFVALPSYMLTPDGATVNFVTTANAVSIISYYVHATDKVLVNYVGKFE